MKYLKIFSLIYFIFLCCSILADDNLKKAIELYELKKYHQAKSLLEKIIDQDEKNETAYFYLGRTYFELSDYDEAGDNFEEALDLNEKNAEYHYWLAWAYGFEARDANIFTKTFLSPKIKKHFEAAVKINPKHVDARIGLANYYIMAPGILGGDIKKAHEQANKIIEFDEKQGRFLLAGIYQKEKNFKKAENECKWLEEKYGNDPGFYNFYNIYGYILLEQKRFDEAIEKFKKQVNLAPDQANPHDSLGDAYRAAGKNNEAIEEYKKAIEMDPSNKYSKEKLNELRKKEKLDKK